MFGSSGILNIFAQSPFKPMQQHMEKIHSCVAELLPFFDHVLAKEWDKAKKVYDSILQKEVEADALKKEIRLHLPQSLFLPVERGDLLGLLTSQDKIASKAKHLAGLIITRSMQFPELIANGYIKFLQTSLLAVAQAHEAILQLDDLIATGFKGKEVKLVEKIIYKLDQTERHADELQIRMRSELFSVEKELHPVDVIFLYKVIDWTGELADRAQHVGHRLESILAR